MIYIVGESESESESESENESEIESEGESESVRRVTPPPSICVRVSASIAQVQRTSV